MTIGIVGGSGDFGQGLAARFRILGEDFVIGSRTPRGGYLANDEASRRSEIVFLCVPPDGVHEMVSSLADALAGRILVSESGIRSAAEIARLAEMRVDAILVGESLVREPDVAPKVRELAGRVEAEHGGTETRREG